jgi:hypothetical protein
MFEGTPEVQTPCLRLSDRHGGIELTRHTIPDPHPTAWLPRGVVLCNLNASLSTNTDGNSSVLGLI